MRGRSLILTDEAIEDIACRTRVLALARGRGFALDWSNTLLDWLKGCAEAGAQLGAEHLTHRPFRTFGYRRQATILAEFAEDELRVVRIYFAGQDWTR